MDTLSETMIPTEIRSETGRYILRTDGSIVDVQQNGGNIIDYAHVQVTQRTDAQGNTVYHGFGKAIICGAIVTNINTDADAVRTHVINTLMGDVSNRHSNVH